METEKKIVFLKIGQKFLYFFALILLVVILAFQTIQCVLKFMQGPTYISSEIVPQKEAEFPAMTVCPETEKYKLDVLESHGIPSIKDYNDGRKKNLTWSSNQTDVSDMELFQLATNRFDELLKRFYIRFFEENPATGKANTDLDLSDPESDPSVQEQRHRSFGRCYTIHPAEEFRKLGLYYFKIYFHKDVKVYFHRYDQYLDLSGRMGYKIYKGETVQTQVSWHDIRMMSKEKDDGSITCIETHYDKCMYGALTDHMHSQTQSEEGCTVPWLLDENLEGTSNICTEPKNINITFWEAWNRVTNQKKDCPVPCDSLLVSLGAKNYKKKNISEQDYGLLYLYFAPRTMFSEELILYTPLSLFAEIGGYVGLLLGVSIWNFAAWISDILELKIQKLQKGEQEDVSGSKTLFQTSPSQSTIKI